MIEGDSYDDLDAAALLAAAEDGVRSRRAEDVRDLLRCLRWADLNSVDPQTQPGAVPVGKGGDKLVTLGGDGTPGVAQLSLLELAIARSTSARATCNATADALDLRHRMPRCWEVARRLECEVWLVRKITTMARHLDQESVALVDLAVSEALHESPGRVLQIAEAKIIEADPDAHQDRVRRNQRRRGVWLLKPKPGQEEDTGLISLGARLEAETALTLDQVLDDLADELATHTTDDDGGEGCTRDQLRHDALSILTRPHDAVKLLDGLTHPTDSPEQPAPVPVADDPAVRPPRHPAPASSPGSARTSTSTLFAHIDADVLMGYVDGVARIDRLGPMLLDQLTRVLGHRHVTLTPVIDLHHGRSVNAYEHPTRVKQRTLLRTVYDVFPHSASKATTRVDHDHPTPYEATGPPGQTGDHNDAPLTRLHHRAKTHHGYHVHQLGPGRYRWTTPHGLAREVGPLGTTIPDQPSGELYELRIILDYAA